MAGQLRIVKTLKFRGRVPSYFFIFVKVMGNLPGVTLGHIAIPF
jgi:hypothetical protein